MSNLKAVPFHQKSYWESRFENEKHFEWLVTWKNVQAELEPYLNEHEDILHLGCGNSELAFELSDSGYKHITNVDYAENVIEYMKHVTQTKQDQLKRDYSDIQWHVGDCLNNLAAYLPKPQYSLVIDKSLVDAIACGDDENQSTVKKLSKEILSVTKPNGHWLSISFSNQRDYADNSNKDEYWETIKKIPVEVKQSNDKPGAPAIYYYINVNKKNCTKS